MLTKPIDNEEDSNEAASFLALKGGLEVREISVVGAVIVEGGRVLCAKRGPAGMLAGLWEFPGGKVEPDESPVEALVREIREELGCVIDVKSKVTTTAHEYEFGIVTLTTYYCRLTGGTPMATEHERIEWVAPENLVELEWAPADIPAAQIIASELQ